MRMILRAAAALLLVATVRASHVFQGNCAEHVLCEQLCMTLSEQAYECACWSEHKLQEDGFSCRANTNVPYSVEKSTKTTSIRTDSEEDDDVEEQVIRLTTPSLPKGKLSALSFKGSNYAEFPIGEDAYLETNITIQFRLDEKRDGILLFAGQIVGDDFLALSIDGPNIVFRHDCGEGTIEDMYHGSFVVGEWHEVTVWRKNCESTRLKIDDGHPLVDFAAEFNNYKGITMDEGVFIGGAPRNIEFLQEKAGTADGIRGCVRKLVINDHVLLDVVEGVNKAVNKEHLESCGRKVTTTPEPYEIYKHKKPPPRVVFAYDLTQPGIPQLTEEQIAELGKQKHLREASSSTTTSTTTAPSTTTTTTTTTPAPPETTAPSWRIGHFHGDSRVVVRAPDDILSYLELQIQFKPERPEGVLFFWSRSEKYLVVKLENSLLKTYVSLGADQVILTSDNVLSLYHWHKVEVWRSGRGILMKVNKQSWVEGQLDGENDDEDGESHLVVGGAAGRISQFSLQEGFYGCLKKVRLNGRTVQLSGTTSHNVTECVSDPCASFGCPQTCASLGNEAVCQCAWPTSGDRCQHSEKGEVDAMTFSGTSYLELTSDKVMNHITGDRLRLNMEFKLANFSTPLDQVLFSGGDTTKVSDGDYLQLVVDSSHFVRFSMNLGSGAVVLTHPSKVIVDRWTTVSVLRRGLHVTLSVNGEDPITVALPEGAEQLNVYHAVVVGGQPPPASQPTSYPTSTGFRGCILSLKLGDDVISKPTQAQRAVNIANCLV
ncbi:unnamed protein product [Caenorhabditis auriculariae]|uniref:Laminin G domain-containing protein n=1 Tax=Caenorhabditis auriculariae TaxID=2777116 RepID=A0A8S1HMV8_9PELO|nr:unnamed protein product [Caenorhabditis auriculariae]